MQLQHLRIQGFRNLTDVDWTPSAGFNVLHGPNGHGKTNLLEAIHFLSTLRSFRSFRNRELLQDGIEEAKLLGAIDRAGRRRTLEVTIHPRARRVKVNESPVRRLSDFFGTLNTVVFTPEDVGMFRGSPSGRRLLLDRFIFNASPVWAEEVAAYESALRQRNAVLKDERPDPALLEVFDVQVARTGAQVIARRLHWVDILRGRMAQAFAGIFDPHRQVDIAYVAEPELPSPGASSPGDLEAHLREALAGSRRRDLARGFTTVGPHRDDLQATIDGCDARTHASQGQHRALILAFRIAEIRLLTEQHGHPPILLLDDVTSEFDARRNERFFEELRRERGQVFITTTDPAWVPLDEPAAHWALRDGRLYDEQLHDNPSDPTNEAHS